MLLRQQNPMQAQTLAMVCKLARTSMISSLCPWDLTTEAHWPQKQSMLPTCTHWSSQSLQALHEARSSIFGTFMLL